MLSSILVFHHHLFSTPLLQNMWQNARWPSWTSQYKAWHNNCTLQNEGETESQICSTWIHQSGNHHHGLQKQPPMRLRCNWNLTWAYAMQCSRHTMQTLLPHSLQYKGREACLLLGKWSSDLWLFESWARSYLLQHFPSIPHIPALSKSSRNKQRVPLPHTGTHLPSHSPRAPTASVHTHRCLSHSSKKQPKPGSYCRCPLPTGFGWPQRDRSCGSATVKPDAGRENCRLSVDLFL